MLYVNIYLCIWNIHTRHVRIVVEVTQFTKELDSRKTIKVDTKNADETKKDKNSNNGIWYLVSAYAEYGVLLWIKNIKSLSCCRWIRTKWNETKLIKSGTP